MHGCAGCDNDRVWAEKISYTFGQPQPGDVIVFAGPPSWNTNFRASRPTNVLARGARNALAFIGLAPNTENIVTKRVIATGGQTVSCLPGDPGVMVDGMTGSAGCGGGYFGPVLVPEGHLWVMGDNRTDSADSRAHLGDELQGTVPVDNVRGKVTRIVYPLSRFGPVQ